MAVSAADEGGRLQTVVMPFKRPVGCHLKTFAAWPNIRGERPLGVAFVPCGEHLAPAVVGIAGFVALVRWNRRELPHVKGLKDPSGPG